MNHKILSFVLFALFSVPIHVASADLIDHMGKLQYFTHKTWLSVQAENSKLANLYAHELEATIKEVQKVESFDGYAIGELATAMLVPDFLKLEKAIKSNDWKGAETAFSQVINACNSCHVSTNHGYVKIQVNNSNPYMQSFEAE